MTDRTRDEIQDDYKWDLETVYGSREEWAEDVTAAETLIDQLQEYEGEVLDSAGKLYAALSLQSQLDRKVERIDFYAEGKKRTDMASDEYQDMVSRARALEAAAEQAQSFLAPEIQAGGAETVLEMAADGPLQAYRRPLQQVFRDEPFTLPKEQEGMLAQIGEVLGNEEDFRDAFMHADLDGAEITDPDGEEVTVTPATRKSLLKRDDRAFREAVYNAFGEEYLEFENLHAALYENHVKTGNISGDVRGFDSARHRSMFNNEIEETVFDNLVAVVRDNLDVQETYYDILQDALDVDQLQPWDTYMSLTGDEGPEIGFDEAFDIVLDALAPLGDEYVETIEAGRGTWIDVYPHENKRGGAFSWGTYDTEPFLFLNHTDDVESLYTLAHELGHSMHTYLAADTQPYQTWEYPIFTAEIASTVNEALLSDHLLETADDELLPHVLNEQINRINATLFAQTLFSEFEHTTHAMVQDGDALTPQTLHELYRDLISDYQPGVEIDAFQERSWMRVPHFYYDYYVYQYATGISAALAIADMITEEGDAAADRHRQFLASGDSKPPLELVEAVGVDLTETDPIERGIDRYRIYLDEMADRQ